MKIMSFFLYGLVLAGISIVSCTSAQEHIDSLYVFDIQTSEELKDFLSYSEGREPIINSHRGGPREGFPENAIETLENTLRYTWSMMEVDPRYTKDSTVVLFHDETLDRTSTGAGRILDYTNDELKELRLKDLNGTVTDFTIPTLDEALEWARGKTILFLDNKDVPVETRAEFIRKHQAHAYAVIMAYSFEDAQKVHDLDPDIIMQVFMPDEQAVERFDQTGIPWENIVAFVTHQWPEDDRIFSLINQRGALAVVGTSRTLDVEYMRGDISEEELGERYRELIRMGADILEPDLGIEAGKAIDVLRNVGEFEKQRYYKINRLSQPDTDQPPRDS